MCQSSRAPVSESSAISPTASPRRTSAATMTRRRSKRSLTHAAQEQEGDRGTVIVIPTSASAVGALDSA